MRKSNPNYSVDEHFAEILSSIETNKIIELYADKKQHLFLYSDSSKYLYELLTNYKNLLRSCLKFVQKFFVTPFGHLSAIFIVK